MWGGGGLLYVDMEAVKNSCYGYLAGYNRRYVGGSSNLTQRFEYDIGDYVSLLKTGNGNVKGYASGGGAGIQKRDWNITDSKQTEKDKYIITFTHNLGYSFRAIVYWKRYSISSGEWLVDRSLITEDNPQLYEELKQNASWL